jgi:hypothetical protein
MNLFKNKKVRKLIAANLEIIIEHEKNPKFIEVYANLLEKLLRN